MRARHFWIPADELYAVIARLGSASLSGLQQLLGQDERGRVDDYALRALLSLLMEEGRLEKMLVVAGRGSPGLKRPRQSPGSRSAPVGSSWRRLLP